MSSIHFCWLKNGQECIQGTLSKMLDASKYWAPDKTSNWSDSSVGVGLARAALFNCPDSEREEICVDESEGLTITVNARLDNRDELASLLSLGEYASNSLSVSQLILASYQVWGRGCVQHLKGEFAFIIWDALKKKVFCARDHFGVKSIFWSQTDKGIMISNEHNAFFSTQWLDANDISEEWLVRHLSGVGTQTLTSPHPDVHLLPPAHTLEIDANERIIHQYWTLQEQNPTKSTDEALIDELRRLFQQAVARRLPSMYPLAAELSEGLDSSGIVGYAANLLGEKPLFTLSYQCEKLTPANKDIWEATYQDIKAFIALHSNLQPIWAEIGETEQWLNEQGQYFMRAFGTLYPYLGFHCRRTQLAAEQGCRVMLSGWGGDHCVTNPGDEYEHELFRQGNFNSLYRLLKAKQTRSRCRNVPKRLFGLVLDNSLPMARRYISSRRNSLLLSQNEQVNHHILSNAMLEKYRVRDELSAFFKSYQRLSVADKERRELLDMGLSNRLLDAELTARRFRIEYRYPMLDLDLVEFAHSLPAHLKSYQGIERYPFRRILEGVATPRIQWRVKSDVATPNIDHNCIRQRHRENIAGQVRRLSKSGYLFDERKITPFLSGKHNKIQLRRMLSLVQGLAKSEHTLNIR